MNLHSFLGYLYILKINAFENTLINIMSIPDGN